MILPHKAGVILAHAEPHVLHPDIGNHPITPNHLHISDSALRGLGIHPDTLNGHDWSDGPEHIGEGELVHVLLKDRLEAYSRMNWQQYEQMRKDAQAVVEVGG